ncbi:MAG TPA: 50S ribosomal protein L29 [Acidimicrobiia bacterium]|nr:50S ribosomal protein L29 [Acidimicrobiia bacterium]
MSKAADLREADESELETRLAEAKQELFNLRFQMVTGQQDNSAMLRTTRREIARILTVLREKEIDAAEAAEAGESA